MVAFVVLAQVLPTAQQPMSMHARLQILGTNLQLPEQTKSPALLVTFDLPVKHPALHVILERFPMKLHPLTAFLVNLDTLPLSVVLLLALRVPQERLRARLTLLNAPVVTHLSIQAIPLQLRVPIAQSIPLSLQSALTVKPVHTATTGLLT